MTPKEFMKNYYTHEAIIKSIDFDRENNKITMNIAYCEWQLEELQEINSEQKGYRLIFNNVREISDENVINQKDEFILVLKLTKTKVYLGLDTKNYTDLSFLYKTFEVEDLKWIWKNTGIILV